MAKEFVKKPVVITAYTFEEFLEYGRQHAPKEATISEKGNPWHFDFHGIPVSQETDEHYIASTIDHGSLNFTANDMIIIGTKPGDIYPCNVETFKTLFDEIMDEPYLTEDTVHTYGMKAVGYKFNPSGSNEVDTCKMLYAQVIDQLNDFRNSTGSGEAKRLASIAITEAQEAQMWGVKAITWRD